MDILINRTHAREECVFVLCVACFTVFVNCLVKQLAIF